MTRLLLAYILTLPAPAGAATIAGRDLAGQNLICGPGSTADNSIPCSPNDVLSGVFTNVGLFQVNAGTTVFVTPATPLVVFASTISIPGLLNGSGRGEVGGIGGDPGQPGGDGDGRGPGIGAYTNMGGGGGAYGGDGGNGSGSDGVLGDGGAAYDDSALPVSTGSISPGSGGGGGGGSGAQTGGSGGQGGASIYLEASSFTLTGTIFVRGVPGGNSTRPADAGGGGAGGGLLLRCMDSATVGGVINANGGKGGDAAGGAGDTAYPGGGGGGGRVKLYYRQAAFSVAISTAGGAKGVKSGSGAEGTPNAQAGSIGAVSFSIVASSPTNLAFPAVFATSITWSWTAAPDWGNAAEASRKYRLYSGTVSYRTQGRFPQLIVSSDTLSATEAGLLPNTAYTRYVTAFTDHSDSLPSAPVSTYTLAGLPGAAASTFTALSAYSLSLNWSAGEPANPGYTVYEVHRSTDIDFGAEASTSYLTALSSAPAGLTPNTTYYFRVRAINMAGLPAGFTPILSTATLAAEPAGPSLVGVGPTGFNFSWNGGGNPPQTRYIAEISTDNFATLSRSSSTLDTGAAFTGLAVNTLYYARVKAQNHNGLDTAFAAVVTTVTAAAPPLNAPVPFTNLSDNSLTFNWDSGGNSAGTNYNAEISTNSGFSAPVSSAVTANLNFIFTGLSVNATYYARVRALGAGGLASLYSSPAVSTVTLTLAPVTASPPFTGVFAGSFTFSWESGGNPGGTLYAAEISKDGFVSVSSAVRTSALGVNFSALEANTVYQARVRAVSFAGIPGAYSSPIVSTATSISAAVNAALPFPSLSAAGLTFAWGDGGNAPGTGYNPEISTSSDFSAPVSSDVTTNLNYVFTGLPANTTYYAHVRAIGIGGNLTSYTGAVSTVTHTLAPVIPSSPYTLVSTTGFTLSWSEGGNPPGTLYAAEISRNSFDTLIASAATLSLSAAFSGLTPNTVYQARIKAVNFLGVDGPYSSPVRSTSTLVTDPLNAAQPYTAVSASTLTFTWADGGNPGGTSYTVELSSAGFSPGTAISSAATLALSQTFSGLLPNTTYYGRAKAVNADDIPSGYSPSVAAVTLPLPPALAAAPFSGVTSSGITFSWTANGNPQNTVYAAELSGNGFVSVSSSVQTTSLNAAFSALTANTVYQARVRAVNFAGIPGQYSSPIVSTATASSLPFNTAVPFLNLSAGGLTFNWESGGNSAGTNYNPEISTSGNFSAPVSSEVTTNLNYVFTGLSVNATYYAHVRAIGAGGNSTAYTGAVSTVTYAIAPFVAAAPFTGVSTTGFTLSWSDGGNPPGTRYAAEISKDSFATLVASASTVSSSAVFAGLTPNTVYQARARARNFLGVDGPYSAPVRSTATLATDPLNSPQPFTAVSAATVTFSWTDGVNPGGTRYIVELSSAGFAPGTAVSSAATLALSQTFGGLLPNTTYYGRARAVNSDEVPSGYSPPVGTVTLPLAPALAAPPFSGVTSSGITFNWTANGNPQATAYVAELSGNGFVSVSSAVQTTSLSAAFSSLAANTVYQARVRAVNFTGLPGDYSSPIVSTVTASSAPGNAAVPFLNLSAGGLTFNWESGGNSAGTNYNPEISTSSNFSAPVSSEVTTNLNYVFTGLSVNATYYAHVRALGAGGNSTAYTGAVSTVTYALAPLVAAAPFTGVSTTGFTLSWSDGGNPPGTLYAAEISRDSFATLVASASTAAGGASFSGLTPNTVYQARARARNFLGVDGPYSAPVRSTATLATDPLNSPQPFTAVSAATVTFSWTDGVNPGGTRYIVELSSAGFAPGTAVSSAATLALSQTFGGLLPNTTYYGRAKAVNADEIASGYSPSAAAVTLPLAPAPAAPPFSGVTSSGITFSWTPNGNPQNTSYVAELSGDGFVSVSSAVQTASLSAAFSALAANTVYQARVRAVNFAGLPGQYSSPIVSTATASSAPGNSAVPFPNVSAAGLTFAWVDGGNPPGTNYNAEISTNSDFSAPVSSDVTVNLNYVFTGLSVNATYYARVRALGAGGLASLYSSPVVSTVTLTVSPVTADPPFAGVFAGSFTFSWENGGNPSGTLYKAEISKDGFVSVSSAAWTSALSAAFSALTANTVYQARVRAVNFAGIPSQFSSPIVSTATAGSVPVNVAAPFLNLSAGGLTFAWGDGGNAAGTGYNLEISTSSSFSAPVSSDVTTNLNYVLTGLSANTTYYAHVRAVGAGGNYTSYTGAVSTVTYALPPAVPASPFTAVSTTSFAFNWSAGGNPLNTRYAAELSRNNFDTTLASAATLADSAVFSGLTPNTVYQARVKAINFLGVDGPYSSPIRSTATLVTDPLNADQPFTAVSASSITFTWASGGNPGGTSYAVELSSAGFAPGTAISSASTLALSQTFGGLLPNTTYYGRARAVNMDDVPGGYSPAVAAVTLPLSPALAAAPFSAVTSSGLALNWTANGNPQNTTYVAEISKDNFVSVSLSSTTRSIPASFTGLTPNTTYTARVKAVNFAGSAGPFADAFVSTATLAVPPQSAVSSFTLTDNGLTVRWSAGDNPPGTIYEAEVSTRSDFTVLWASAAATGASGNFALAANTTYYARVRARNYNSIPTADLGLGGELTYAAPPAASASVATGAVNVTTFSFINAVSTGTGGLLFYRTAWDRNATHVWNDQEPAWDALTVVTTTATGNGFWFLHLRSYNFKALGYKTADIGPFHVALSTVIPPGQPVPVPGAFTATSGITWNWPPALAFGDTAISTYVVSVGTTPADFNVLVDSEIGPLASFTLDPAANGRTYYLKVKAIDEGGIFSQYSAVSSPGVLVDRTAPARLGAVLADREFSYDSAALFSWPASADQESGIKAYLLDLGTTRNGNEILSAKNVGLALSSLETGLPSGKTVFARVRAENNAGGISDYSDPGPGIPVWSLSQEPPMVQPYNWPNPFDPLAGPTQIGFYLKAPAKVTFKLFTLEGNLVYEETRGEGTAGNKVWPWSGRSGTGKITAPGGYVCIIEKKYAGKTERQQFKLAVLY